ncbi:uncharacterized protein [Drosophila tropicalis]|uniref:uncharacterized protein n=1 Tax=Drosophila tropicalis TaxID=46794 RepID=UPI0035AC0CC5
MLKFVCLFALIASTAAAASEADSLLTSALKMVKDCGDRSMVLCMNERALHYFDTENGDVRLTEGIALVKTIDIPVGRSLNDVKPEEVEARESEVDSLLVEPTLLESKKENYEVVEHPHYEHEHSYDRSLQAGEAQNLAYAVYLMQPF